MTISVLNETFRDTIQPTFSIIRCSTSNWMNWTNLIQPCVNKGPFNVAYKHRTHFSVMVRVAHSVARDLDSILFG